LIGKIFLASLILLSSRICYAGEYKIVSLAPNATEILFALGLGDSVAAVDAYSNYPEEALGIDKAGTFVNPDIEKIILIKPDHLLVSAEMDSGMMEFLKRAGIGVIKVSPESVDALCDDILMIGGIFHKEENAGRIVSDIKERILRIARGIKTEKPKVFVRLFDDPLITGSRFIGDVIRLAGGENVAWDIKNDSGVFSYEVLIERAPDIIISAGFSGDVELSDPVRTIKNARVYKGIDPDILLRPGPRTIDAIEELNRVFYDKD